MAGNFRPRIRRVEPTGEKHSTTWRYVSLAVKFSSRLQKIQDLKTHLELPADTVNEEGPAVLSSILLASILHLIPHATDDTL